MRLTWYDEHLTWDPAEYAGLNQIHFGSEELWKPDIYLYNNADSSNMQHYGKTHFLVFNSSQVRMMAAVDS